MKDRASILIQLIRESSLRLRGNGIPRLNDLSSGGMSAKKMTALNSSSLDSDFTVQPLYSLSFQEERKNALCSDTSVSRAPVQRVGIARLLSTVLANSIPILDQDPVDQASIRDFGGGGTYLVTRAELAHSLSLPDCRIGHPSKPPKVYPKGSPVVVKAINHSGLTNAGGQELDYSAISTELTILSYPPMVQNPWIVNLIGIGWEPSPYQPSETVRYFPYILTESGDLGNLENFFRINGRKTTAVSNTNIMKDKHKMRDWNQNLENLGSFQPVERAGQIQSTSWDLKIGMALSIGRAIRDLHHCGIVHGDIKMANVVVGKQKLDSGCEELSFKLCDFGSSLILSDYTDMDPPRCRLLSMTFPWEAPEVRSSLSPEEAVKTDVYSFGLLFAGILLDGNCPFDESFDIRYDAIPKNNPDEIKRSKDEGQFVPRLFSRLRDTMTYTEERLIVVERILAATLAQNPNDRISCMETVIAELEVAASCR